MLATLRCLPLTLLCFYFGCAVEPQNNTTTASVPTTRTLTNPGQMGRPMRSAAEGLSISVDAPAEAEAGAQIDFEINVANISGGPITTWIGAVGQIADIEIFDANGLPVALTRYGKLTQHPGVRNLLHHYSVRLKAGGTVGYFLRISNLFDLSVPGPYTVIVHLEVPNPLGSDPILTAKPFTIQIVYPPGVKEHITGSLPRAGSSDDTTSP